VSDANFASPVFNGFPRDEDDGLRDDILEMISDDGCCLLVAEVDGRIAATAEVIPVEESPMHAGVIRVDGQVLLGFAATAEWARGRGSRASSPRPPSRGPTGTATRRSAIDWRVAQPARPRGCGRGRVFARRSCGCIARSPEGYHGAHERRHSWI